MSYVFQGWQEQLKVDGKLLEIAKKVEAMHKGHVERKFVYLWLSATHTSKIETQMLKLYNVKWLKEIINGWRQIKNKNNQKRIHVHRIKEKLRQRPELARPILALRNMLAFRAFNKLFAGARLVSEEDRNNDTAHCAYYMRITKKTFLSLKLNS